ncbi:MAG: hypothetical protein ACRD4C_00705 [Candidatus Acidiferrales bacterium]
MEIKASLLILCNLTFYGDHSGIFVRNDDGWTVEEQLVEKRQPTQFGRALKQLGVTFLPASSPQTKGRIERLGGVLQDYLTSELRLAHEHRFRQRGPASIHRRLQSPFRPAASRKCNGVAGSSKDSREHLLLRA